VVPETRAHLQEVLEREQKYLDAEKQPRVYSKALGDDSFAGTSLWLERTQWPVTYKGVRRDILQAMTRLPISIGIDPNIDTHFVLGQGPHEGDADIVSLRRDEQKISCVLGAVDLMLDRCELTVQHTSRLLRCWLVSSKPGNCQPKPFALMTQENTRKKYRILWKRFIAFIFRAYLMPVTLRERELKIYLSPEMSRQLDRLWAHEAWDFIDVTRRRWPQMSKIGNERSLLDASVDARDEPVSSIYEEMAGWYSNSRMSDDDASSMTEDSEDGFEEFQEEESDETFEEATTNLASEHTRVESWQWKEANFQANDRAAASALDEFLEFLFQLSVALSTERFLDGQAGSTLLIYFSGILGFSADCRQFRLARQYCPYLSGLIYIQRLIYLEWALPLAPYSRIGINQRPRTQQLEHLNRVRGVYMVAGSPSALAELHSLRNFGHRAAQTEPPTFFLHWSDDGDKVSFGDDFVLSMKDFRQLADHFITRAEELCHELMFGFEPDFDICRIKDDMTNTKPGYSFVMHPENGFQDMYKDLLTRACTSRIGRLSRNGQWSWNAITSFLKKTTMLEETLGGGFLTSCGQTPRLLELLSLSAENSPSAVRGIFIWNGSIAYALRHHKAKRSTNQEFYVVRFLPLRLAIVVLKYLVCIRRLANLLRREQFGPPDRNKQSQSRHLLFHSHGKAWAPTRLTTILRTASKQVWNREINARVYRQLAIGITEKHVQEVHSPFNRYDDRSADTDLNVVFAWQSAHRPMQRGVTYGLDGAYPHQLQPSLLRAYEWASTRWHEFLHQASKALPAAQGESLPMTIRHTKLESAKAVTPVYRNDKSLGDGTTKKRKRTSVYEKSRSTESALDPSLVAPTHSAIRVDGLATILPEYRILICLICRTAVRPGEAIESHFRRTHRLKGERLKAVKVLHSGWLLQDPLTMAPMDNKSRIIPELEVQHGYSCKACIYFTISRDNVLKHYSQRHPELAKSGERNYEEVSLQTWMKGKFVQYWTVLHG
jgi:hypothetical protein